MRSVAVGVCGSKCFALYSCHLRLCSPCLTFCLALSYSGSYLSGPCITLFLGLWPRCVYLGYARCPNLIPLQLILGPLRCSSFPLRVRQSFFLRPLPCACLLL